MRIHVVVCLSAQTSNILQLILIQKLRSETANPLTTQGHNQSHNIITTRPSLWYSSASNLYRRKMSDRVKFLSFDHAYCCLLKTEKIRCTAASTIVLWRWALFIKGTVCTATPVHSHNIYLWHRFISPFIHCCRHAIYTLPRNAPAPPANMAPLADIILYQQGLVLV